MMKQFSILGFGIVLLFFVACESDSTIGKEQPDTTYKGKKNEIVYDYDKQNNLHSKARKFPGTWSTLNPIPAATEGASVANVGDKIIVALGFSGGDRDWTRIYDILTDTWSMGSAAPGMSSEGAGTSHGGLFYSVGGRGAGFNALWSYDISTDTWAVLPNMPTARLGLAVATVGNDIYAIGGRTGGQPQAGGVLAVVEKYNINTATWSTVAALPSARSDLAAVAHGGNIYVLGGFDAAGVALADVDVYDPVTDTWSTAPTNMPTARATLYAAGIKGGTIFAIGGWDGITFPGPAGNVVESYRINKDTWTTGYAPMPTARGEAGAVSHGGQIYLVGGATPAFGNSIPSMEAFKP